MDDIFNNDGNDSNDLGSRTWQRLISSANKAGYREGIEEGSQVVLQTDFDRGYIDGFKVAYILGKYKSFNAFELNGMKHPREINDILEKIRKGVCYICKLKSDTDIADDSELIINHHQEYVSKTLHTLYSYFQPLLKDRGIDISNLKYE